MPVQAAPAATLRLLTPTMVSAERAALPSSVTPAWVIRWQLIGVIVAGRISFDAVSGGPSVVGHFTYLALGGFFRDMNPAQVAVARDLHAHERVEGMLVDTFVAMTHDGAVDIP